MERLMTAKQVSELIEVKPSTIYQWVHEGLIPYVKLGKCVRFKKDELFGYDKTEYLHVYSDDEK